ncbi:MAG: 50S ribosomal protein L6 [Candidatus Omnitrophica bacterium CG11_big_fil_rev_8_21_14_0_20_45_26]|uniref:Large ribosomal subunit protein uL6 n=1 Tax=Candidatus Abzuiibacterium crystallinum TaxID=1974748 RepID=A0A2H0LQW6_9BACT|nr:MAG: 50S ribosomal protein L6 [Candidatus Omnitrophica bacterium CG11_big_fil_rev_8_21_14_0_20_45_26]PIW65095.1 MAG: 50S ribosomal protein L6 [Candidatus Omnitrophica bacterium CG12_big_fil_rev_8_21_14_0_65_45_16]
MSRVGYKPIQIPSGVKIQVSGPAVTVEGPKGKLTQKTSPLIKIQVEKDQISFKRSGEDNRNKALHGLTRSLVQNMIHGVVNEFTRQLQIEGVGFKAQVNGQNLQLSLGYSHQINYVIPSGVKVTAAKPTQISVSGIDATLVGQVAAEIRSFYKPEPYKGKGVRYADEHVRRKKGKAVA